MFASSSANLEGGQNGEPLTGNERVGFFKVDEVANENYYDHAEPTKTSKSEADGGRQVDLSYDIKLGFINADHFGGGRNLRPSG